MKETFILLLMVVMTAASCNKDGDISSQLQGNWELRQTYSGNIMPAVFVPGNPYRIRITKDMFERRTGGLVEISGKYQLATEKIADNNKERFITFKVLVVEDALSGRTMDYRIHVKGNSLEIASLMNADMPSAT